MKKLGAYVECRYDGYVTSNGEPVLKPVYLATLSIPAEKQHVITVNDIGSESTDSAIQMLDKMIQLTKEYPEDDDPFQYNDETSLFSYSKDGEDVPAGAKRR